MVELSDLERNTALLLYERGLAFLEITERILFTRMESSRIAVRDEVIVFLKANHPLFKAYPKEAYP